jgi:hypothetical protein
MQEPRNSNSQERGAIGDFTVKKKPAVQGLDEFTVRYIFDSQQQNSIVLTASLTLLRL